MNRKRWIIALVGATALAWVACQRLPERTLVQGDLPFVTLEATDSIPLEYGELVAVTPSPSHQYHAVLWFEQPDKTIVGVRVNVSRGVVWPSALTIPRR